MTSHNLIIISQRKYTSAAESEEHRRSWGVWEVSGRVYKECIVHGYRFSDLKEMYQEQSSLQLTTTQQWLIYLAVSKRKLTMCTWHI